jgi:hypothetical protein
LPLRCCALERTTKEQRRRGEITTGSRFIIGILLKLSTKATKIRAQKANEDLDSRV